MAGEAAQMRFINDAIDQRNVELLIVPPVEMVLNHDTVSSGMSPGLISSPCCAIRYHAGVGIEQAAGGIEAVDLWFKIGLHVEAERVVRADVEALDKDMPHLADTVDVRVQRDFTEDPLGAWLVEQQLARSSGLGKDREIHSSTVDGGPQRQRMSVGDVIRSRRQDRINRGRCFGTFCCAHDEWPASHGQKNGIPESGRRNKWIRLSMR